VTATLPKMVSKPMPERYGRFIGQDLLRAKDPFLCPLIAQRRAL
jgi:hypothetical protein